MHGCLDCHGNGSAKRETHSRAAEDKTISRLAIRSPSTEWRRLAQLDGCLGERVGARKCDAEQGEGHTANPSEGKDFTRNKRHLGGGAKHGTT